MLGLGSHVTASFFGLPTPPDPSRASFISSSASRKGLAKHRCRVNQHRPVGLQQEASAAAQHSTAQHSAAQHISSKASGASTQP